MKDLYIAQFERKRKRAIDRVERHEKSKLLRFRIRLFERLKEYNDSLEEIREHEIRYTQASKVFGESSSISTQDFDNLDSATAQLVRLPEFASEMEIEQARSWIWSKISSHLIPRACRIRLIAQSNAVNNASIIAQLCQRDSKKREASSLNTKEVLFGPVLKKVNREMILYWRKNEKEEREARKRAEKELIERLKQEEEQREKRRQARKLNFLITQTELFSHFIGNKLNKLQQEPDISENTGRIMVSEIDFDSVDDQYLNEVAKQQAQTAVAKQKDHISAFDQSAAGIASQIVEVVQPRLLNCKLKPYQLKGLNWLANLYEQGINGILADDMGLGKTVQSISLLAWLAESHNVWGPFLVVSPASTLHNWQQEFAKFCPALNVLPYWGNLSERKTLRKFWASAKKPCRKDSPWHVLITSYQFVVSDQKYFQKLRWQYMLLDEAHAIKSSSTARWKTLLNFKCRNRLLLTGTPIQNSMAELWALLHFIMPTMFDSHEEFSEWFSKDIESHATDKGKLNERQLNRLHMILKPFMLRRVKSEVEHELGSKIEKTIYCDLSSKQRGMYSALAERISVDDLLDRVMLTEDARTRNGQDSALMNAMMQLRKVCNHPQIFELAEAQSPLSFTECASVPLSMDDIVPTIPLNARNPIAYPCPRLVCEENINYKTQFCRQIISIFVSSYLNTVSTLSRLAAGSSYSQRECAEIRNADLFHRVLLYSRLRDSGKSEYGYGDFGIGMDDIFLRKSQRLAICYPAVVAPPIELTCSSNRLLTKHKQQLIAKKKQILQDNRLGQMFEIIPESFNSSRIFLPKAGQLIFDCGKLFALDKLLGKLKCDNHRVLLYFQMTKMIDLMEDYLTFRKYTYLRLDGSVSISDRRDLVHEWQTKDDIFIFLLSTRAGGLGINLTAADTVIFYDSDWNPTVDQQAMDRSHRLGQTKQVTVYRLVTKGTIEERILQRAMEKDAVQKVVIASGAFE